MFKTCHFLFITPLDLALYILRLYKYFLYIYYTHTHIYIICTHLNSRLTFCIALLHLVAFFPMNCTV